MAFPVPGPGGGFPALPFQFRSTASAGAAAGVGVVDFTGEYTDGPASYSVGMQTARVARIDCWAMDMLEIIFAQPMKNTPTLRAPVTYTLAIVTGAVGASTPAVKLVKTDPAAVTVDRAYLWITRPTVGTRYRASVVGDVRASDDTALHPSHATADWIQRRTVVDTILKQRVVWNQHHAESLRHIANQIGRSLDLIGGTRDDTLE